MMGRNKAVAACTMALCLLVLVPLPAGARTLRRTAWWSSLHRGAADLSPLNPAPPPKGGLTVGATPQGATAISGIRYELDPGDTAPVLHLTVDPSSTNGSADGIVLLACLAGAAWSEGGSQDLASAPPALCDEAHGGASVAGQRDASKSSWTFPVARLQLGLVLDVLLVPATASGTPVQPYQLNFAAPTGASLTTTPAASSPPPPAPEPPPLAANRPATQPRLASAQPSTDPGPPAFSTAADPADAALTFAPLLTDEQQQITATAPILQRFPELRGQLGRGGVRGLRIPGWVRALGLIEVVGGALLIGYSFRSRAAESPDPEVRGLGAFVAPRAGSVPSL